MQIIKNFKLSKEEITLGNFKLSTQSVLESINGEVPLLHTRCEYRGTGKVDFDLNKVIGTVTNITRQEDGTLIGTLKYYGNPLWLHNINNLDIEVKTAGSGIINGNEITDYELHYFYLTSVSDSDIQKQRSTEAVSAEESI